MEHLWRSKVYEMWRAMKRRCRDPKFKDYAIYGGRGITVCEEWQQSVHAFVRDMGMPVDGMTLDRIDPNKGYCKENCRWATRAEQTYNRRSGNVFLTFNGVTKPINAWSKSLGLSQNAVRLRLKAGWSVEKALTTGRTDSRARHA